MLKENWRKKSREIINLDLLHMVGVL